MKKSAFSFRVLFDNNRFVMVFSLILAIIIWLSISISVSPTVTDTLNNVPVSIPLENTTFSNLKAFGNETKEVQVSIQGKKYVTSAADSSDITVTANIGQIVGAGIYTLELNAQKNTGAGDFDIISVFPSTIVVRLDYEESVSLDLSVEAVGISVSGDSLSLSSYIADSTKKSVTVTGAKSEVTTIKRAVAVCSETATISKTTSYPSAIKLYDAEGKEVSLLYSSLNYSDVDIIVSVEKHKVVPLTVTVINGPVNRLGYTIYENSGDEIKKISEITIQGDTETVDSMNELSVGTVDFSDLANDLSAYSVNFEFPEIGGISFPEYNSSAVSFTVKFSAKKVYTKSFEISADKVVFTNLNSQESAVALSTIKGVSVMSTSNDVTSKLSAADIIATVDCSKLTSGTYANVPVTISFNGYKDCWATGDYTITIKIS